ncbi:MAG TPA: hypothetical protein VHU91_04875 [Mycobacteriales bacterium]|jgi:hypothetical protein|nr:hypothetical protein [Mycobacteriales bacterium]
MNTDCTLKRIIAGVVLTGGVAVAGLGLAGAAQALPGTFPRYMWCPGQPWQWLTPPPADWDMHVCHNVMSVHNADGSWRIAEDPNPPPPQPSIADLCRGAPICLPGL